MTCVERVTFYSLQALFLHGLWTRILKMEKTCSNLLGHLSANTAETLIPSFRRYGHSLLRNQLLIHGICFAFNIQETTTIAITKFSCHI